MKPGGTCWDETGCSVEPIPDSGETSFSVQCGQGLSIARVNAMQHAD